MTSTRFYLENYGCSANIAYAEKIRGQLSEAEYRAVSSPIEADLNIIVTCTVKAASSLRMTHRIKELTRLSRPLIVAGCMPKTERYIIDAINPSASLLGPKNVDRVVESAIATLRGEKKVIIDDSMSPKVLLPRIRRNPVVGIIEIATGCLSNCSYCQVKIAKGRLVSYPPEAILQEAITAINNGCQEIWLTSQDCGCYGKDIGKSLPMLLNSLCQIDGQFWIRVGMANPSHLRMMTNDLIEAYRHKNVLKFLHVPVQSGSNRILNLMNRNYTVQEFVWIIEKFICELPYLTFSTDIIVGFPTERDEDFNETVNLLEKVQPDIVNVSRFGPRPGTKAAKMSLLDPNLVKSRSSILHGIIKTISLRKNKKWIGWQGDAIIDEKVKNATIARNFAYKPILIRSNLPLGCWIKVKVVDATPNCLLGNSIHLLC